MAQDGVQFEAAPISVDSPCKPVIFKGTKRSAGTAFLMPRLRLAKTSRGTDAIEFLKLRSGKRLLQIGLYFPQFSINGETITYENYQRKTCNYQQIKQAINQKLPQGERKIEKIVTLQVQNISVEVSTVDGEFSAASKDTKILNYLGQVKKFEIPLADQNSWNDVMDVLESEQGLRLNVNFDFLARESNGYCKVKLDLNKVADQIKTTVNAQYQAGGKIAKLGGLRGAVGDAIKNVDLSMIGTVYCEESSNTQFTASFYKQLATILTNMGQNFAGYQPPSYLGYGGYSGYDPGYPGGGGTVDPWPGDDNLIPDAQGSTTGSDILSGTGGSSSYIDDPTTGYTNPRTGTGDGLPTNQPPAKFKGQGAALQAFLQRLREQKVYEFETENNGKNEVRRFTTSVPIRKDLDGRPRLTLTSGAESQNTRVTMNEGDVMKIYPLRKVIHNFEYRKEPTYYSKETLDSVKNIFPMLQLADPEDITEKNNIGYFVLRDKKSTKRLVYTGWGFIPVSTKMFGQYVFGEENYMVEALKEVKVPFKAEKVAGANGVQLKKALTDEFNIGFIFNKKNPGKTYSIYKLIQMNNQESAFVDVEYNQEDDVFVMTAKKDLGVLKLKNLTQTDIKSFAPKKYFQGKRSRAPQIIPRDFKGNFRTEYVGNPRKEDMPVKITDLILKIEKVGYHNVQSEADESQEVPVNLYHESSDPNPANGTGAIFETTDQD